MGGHKGKTKPMLKCLNYNMVRDKKADTQAHKLGGEMWRKSY